MVRIFVFYFVAVMLALTAAARADTITIAGKVLNKTTNSPIVGAEVKLVRPNGEEGGGKVLATAQSGNGGAFEFPNQEVAGDDLLVGRVEWDNYPYETPLFDGAGRLEQFKLKIDPKNTTVEVYNSTVEPPDLQLMVHHLALASSDKGLRCVERMVVENPSNKTFIGLGPRQTSILLNLPRGARDVKLDPKVTGAKLVKTGEGYGVSKAITPSSYNNRNTIAVEYMMDWPSALPWQREIDFSRQTAYPTFFFFVARESGDQDLQVIAPKLQKDTIAPVPIDGQQQQRIVNAIGTPNSGDHALEPGSELKIVVRRPVPTMFWGFLGLFGCILLFLPLALMGARRRRSASDEEYSEEYSNEEMGSWEPQVAPSVIAGTSFADMAQMNVSSSADPQRVRMMANDVARLEEAWKAGQVEEAEYQMLRAEKKDALVRLLLAGQ